MVNSYCYMQFLIVNVLQFAPFIVFTSNGHFSVNNTIRIFVDYVTNWSETPPMF